eukprot:XP_765158.1 hypothetical protein [Theileria parva strain Muguga]
MARSRFVYSILFGIVFLVLGYFLLELKTENFANYFILHVGVLHFLLVVFVKDRIHSPFIITLHTICIGYSMTLIIVYSCSYYSKYKSGLLWFICGLFSARSFPHLLMNFVDKNEDHHIQVQSLSESLATWRFVFCLIAFLMKLTMGQAKYDPISKGPIELFKDITNKFTEASKEFENFPKSLLDDFKCLFDHVKKTMYLDFRENKVDLFDKILSYLTFYLGNALRITSFFFMFSAAVILKSVPLTHLIYFRYSAHQKLILDNIKRVCHLMGCCFGVAYPLSVTSNHRNYYIVTFLVYILDITLSFALAYLGHYLSLHTLYTLVSLAGFALGYTFSYSLGAFSNSILIQTCSKQERLTIFPEKYENIIPCCGEKFNDKCYCRYERFEPPKDLFPKPFLCSKFIMECKYLEYDPSGNCAIIICVNDSNITQLSQTPCSEQCCNNNNCKCLRLLGIYTLDAVTTSVCGNCQLTVRLEGVCSDGNGKCSLCTSSSSGESSVCNGEKCCLCVKCCTEKTVTCSCCTNCDQGNCCCIKFCCCGDKCPTCQTNCHCKITTKCQPNGGTSDSDSEKIKEKEYKVPIFRTRLFIYFKNGTEGSCLREIKPNTVDFDGQLEKGEKCDKSEIFDIQGITLLDCCHASMRIDLHCSLRNNYYRLNGVNYPKKFAEPNSLCLFSKLKVCCDKTPTQQCCCPYRKLTKVFISRDPEEKPKCNHSDSNSGSTTNCQNCKSMCELTLDKTSSFVKKVNKFRVKLIVLSFIIFGFVYFITQLFITITRYRNRPKFFDPRATYDQVDKLIKNKKFNSVDQVSERLTSLINLNRLVENANAEKITHLKKMSEALSRYMNEVEHLRVVRNMEDKASKFPPKSNRQDLRNLDEKLIVWSHWVGFFYAYAFPLYVYIQRFFFKWEVMWNVEHENYIRFIKPKLNKISHTSRYSLTLLSVLTHTDKLVRSIGITRTHSWITLKEELNSLTKLDQIEKKLDRQALPASIGERLEYFITTWTHRRRYLGNWIVNKTNVFDWEGFRVDYEEIEDWIEIVSPYLKLGNDFVNIPLKELNEGIEQ